MRQVLFGTDEVTPTVHALHAGPLTAQLRGTRLGPITIEGHEVWHGVDFLFRDPDWGTPQPIVEHVDHATTATGIRVGLHGCIGTFLSFNISIEGEADHLRYEVTATLQSDVQASRAGLVLMHPLSACGRSIQVEHTDGRTSVSTFPVLIAPWPPFTLVRALRHEYAPGAWALCRLAGDDFEMEDQRNNADASFKTYSRSNLMPRPYTLHAGTVLRQSAELRVQSRPVARKPDRSVPVRVALVGPATAWPRIGTAIAAADLQRAAGLTELLATLAPAHLHLALEHPGESFNPDNLARVLAAAGGCALRLNIDRVLADDGQLHRLAGPLLSAGVVPCDVAVFPSTPAAVAAARRAFPGSRVGGGTPHFFTQLNRIEDLAPVDFLAFTTSSVVHGVDDEDVMAGLQSLPAMADTLRFRHGPLPLQIGPSSIGARRSPIGGQPASDGMRRLALARRDPRTSALFGAAWAVGYVAQFARARVESITLFDLVGDAALLGPGGLTTPAFEVLRRLASASAHRPLGIPDGVPLAGVAIEGTKGGEIILANLGAEPLVVALPAAGLPTHAHPPAQARLMDVQSLLHCEQHPGASPWRLVDLQSGGALELPAYAVAFA